MSDDKNKIVKMVKEYTEEVIDGELCWRHVNGNIYSKSSYKKLLAELKEKGGMLRAEYGCPPIATQVGSEDHIRRTLTVDDERVCGEIDVSTIQVIGDTIVADVRPIGPFADALLGIAAPQFGVRAFTAVSGNNIRELKQLITFDLIFG